jgi:predicted  nucleic acid-binding Zn-ribbon protein
MGNITNLLAIPVLTGIIAVTGFYYITTYRLDEYRADIDKVNKIVAEKASTDDAARNKIRDDLLANQVRTAEGISKLDTRLAVAETNQKTANDTLQKIADTLQRITTVAVTK